jgi:hypothetical protein
LRRKLAFFASDLGFSEFGRNLLFRRGEQGMPPKIMEEKSLMGFAPDRIPGPKQGGHERSPLGTDQKDSVAGRVDTNLSDTIRHCGPNSASS